MWLYVNAHKKSLSWVRMSLHTQCLAMQAYFFLMFLNYFLFFLFLKVHLFARKSNGNDEKNVVFFLNSKFLLHSLFRIPSVFLFFFVNVWKLVTIVSLFHINKKSKLWSTSHKERNWNPSAVFFLDMRKKKFTAIILILRLSCRDNLEMAFNSEYDCWNTHRKLFNLNKSMKSVLEWLKTLPIVNMLRVRQKVVNWTSTCQ